MLADINFATGLRAQLQNASLGYLAGAVSGLAIAGAALELGINEALVRAAISDLGIICARHSLTEEEYEKIKVWIRTRGIAFALDEHVIKKNMVGLRNVEKIAFCKSPVIYKLIVHGLLRIKFLSFGELEIAGMVA